MKPQLDRRHLIQAGLAGAVAAWAGGVRPALATDAAPPLSAYARSPFIAFVSISPNGDKIAAVTHDGDQSAVREFSRTTSEARTINLGAPKVRGVIWADNDRLLVMSSVVGQAQQYGGFRNEIMQARIIDPASGKMKLLWGDEFNIASNMVVGDIHRIQTADGYSVTAGNYLGYDAYCLETFPTDLNAPSTPHITERHYRDGVLPCFNYYTEGVVVTPDGRVHAISYNSVEGHGKTKEWVVQLNTASPGKPPFMKEIFRTGYDIVSPRLLGLAGDGASLVIQQFDPSSGRTFRVLFANGTLSEPLDAGAKAVNSAPLFHPATFRLAGFAHTDDGIVYDYFDPTFDAVAKAVPQAIGEEYRTTIIEYADDPRRLVVRVEGDDDAGSYYFLDLTTGKTNFLGDAYPQLPKDWLAPKKSIRYKAADGLEIPAYLTLPPKGDPRNLPLVVLPHGGPQSRDTLDFDWQAQALASRGYAVLQPNFRGSGGYGLAFQQAGFGEFGRKMQTDLSDGVRFLVAQGTVDPRRVAICGASYGGYAALAGAAFDPGVYNCAISIAGLSDLKYQMQKLRDMEGTDYGAGRLYWQQYFGDLGRIGDISPVEHADRVAIPVLLVHGKDDTVVEYEHSVRMDKALRAAGKTVEFVSYAGQDHWETIKSARSDMLTRIVTFLGKHNPA